MAINSWSDESYISPGPYLAKVVNHLDPTYMGGLEVTIIKAIPGLSETQSSNVIVKYCSPFFGQTSSKFEGNDSSNFDDVQKSYGFWMVPPDIGATVMVMFIEGDINQGYWFGCVPDIYQNQMVPGIAASQFSAVGPQQEDEYGTRLLPVAEYHKKSRGMEIPNPDSFTKPVHPFANRLKQQGLLLDTVRGVTSSSARREVPSMVFGISTPGPIDQSTGGSPAKRQNIGFKGSDQVRIPVSRLGGTQFVMDDGDKDGQNELVRIRTRTGHQILLHNSSDLIYISNSKGSAWVELTSNGKIDIYAEDSISVHTEQDFNFRADRDVNIEAGRNVNISAAGGMELNSVDRFYLVCDGNGKILVGGDLNLAVGADLREEAGGNASFVGSANVFIATGGTMNQTASGDWKVGAGTSNITSGEHRETAGRIEMNGPSALIPGDRPAIEVPEKLVRFSLPNRSAGAGWSNGNFYRSGSISSIMQRVPTHEPWDQHENINPSQFSASNTDVQVNAPVDTKGGPTSGTGAVPVNKNPVAVPASKSGAANEQYLQSILIQAGITDPIKLAQFMGQCKHESGYFQYLEEIASGSAYEGRSDLGNTQSGDGVKFKGRGFIQCTGRVNYQSMTKYFNVDFVNNPTKLADLEWAAKSVLWFFNVARKPGFKNLTMTQPYSDTTVFWEDTLSVSAMVNGGKNGLAERIKFFNEYKQKFTTQGIAPSGTVGTGSGGSLVDSSGAPVRSGQ
jgi:predicted chitinase